jgi:hypothetical protein
MPHLGTVPQRGEKCPEPELDEFLRPVLELERCLNGTQYIHAYSNDLFSKMKKVSCSRRRRRRKRKKKAK